MKIKLFLAPSLIVIMMSLLIWTVYPAYTDGTNGVKEKHRKVKDQERLMTGLDDRMNNAVKLIADLDANASDSEVVFDYISRKKEDEKIIDNLDLLARDSLLSVANISVSEMKSEIVPDQAIVPVSEADPIAPVQPAAVSAAAPDKIEVDFSVFGAYENIKILLEKIQKLKRFSKISDLEIKVQTKEGQPLSEALLADITLEFNYLKEPNKLVDGDIDNSIFFSGIFNKEVIEKIKNSRSISVNNVSPGQKGITNPFLP